MNVIEKINKLIDKVGYIGDQNFNYLYDDKEYHSALQFASQYQNISGVSEQIVRLKENNRQYREKLDIIISQNYENVNQRYRKWRRNDVVKTFFKGLTIISIALILVSYILTVIISLGIGNAFSRLEMIASALLFFCEKVVVIGVIGLIIFKIFEKNSGDVYYHYKDQIEDKAKALHEQYVKTINTNRKKIDQLYLNTLDPAHREMILMRRDQERQHQEMMNQQRRHNEAMLREQERTRNAQEELLRIEQERERRWNG